MGAMGDNYSRILEFYTVKGNIGNGSFTSLKIISQENNSPQLKCYKELALVLDMDAL